MNIKGYECPEELYYHKEHTWVRIENDGNVRIGLTDFYGKSAGDTTYADLPEAGDEIEQHETMGKIQSSKWVGKLLAPVSGEILEINESLEDDFMMINKDPYGNGWIARIAPSNLEEELGNLHHGVEAMTAFIEKEILRAESGGSHAS
jgi:glycine cleavage system H protein